MASLSMAQIYAYARGAGFDPAQATIAAAIAMGESGGNPAATGDVNLQNSTWGPSVGLMQIRTLRSQTGTGGVRDITQLSDPGLNMAAAYTISGGGKDWSPWTVYTSGKYRQYLGQASTASRGYVPGVGAVDVQPVGLVDGLTGDLIGKLRDAAIFLVAVGAGAALIIAGTYRAWGPVVKGAIKAAV